MDGVGDIVFDVEDSGANVADSVANVEEPVANVEDSATNVEESVANVAAKLYELEEISGDAASPDIARAFRVVELEDSIVALVDSVLDVADFLLKRA